MSSLERAKIPQTAVSFLKPTHPLVAEDETKRLTPTDATHPSIHRTQSRAFLSEDGLPQPIEFFLASDPSAIIEHTKRVLYLEDNDIAHIDEGGALCQT